MRLTLGSWLRSTTLNGHSDGQGSRSPPASDRPVGDDVNADAIDARYMASLDDLRDCAAELEVVTARAARALARHDQLRALREKTETT